MYGQGNHAPQFRHGPPTLLPPFQQGPPAHHPPPFQQPPPAPPPPVIRQVPSAAPPHVVQSGSAIYQHGPPPPPPPVQQGGPPPLPQSIRVPAPVISNMGQSYLHPPPSVHGSSPVPSSYPTTQQNAQYLSPIPPGPPLAGPSHPEMIRAPLPPRVFPPPPSQRQMLYRTPLHLPPPGIGQGFQHGQLLPPPPPSSFVPVTPAPFASYVHTSVEDAHPPSMPLQPPPPPPSSPPPLPPSPPPPASPTDLSVGSFTTSSIMPTSSGLPHHSESGCGTDKLSDSMEKVSFSVDKAVGPSQITNDEDGLSKKQPFVALPSPPKPADEEIIRKIEVLCQFIAKNGPDFEDIAREKEYGNPKFAFLIGGEPGSEAAIAYEYYQWTKRKYHMESKFHNGSEQSDSLVRPLEIGSSTQPNNLIDEDASHSPADSDMDMEVDVNQSDKDQGIADSIEGLSNPVSMCNEVLTVKEQLHAAQCSTECPTSGNALSRIVSSSESSVLAKEERDHDQSTFGRPFAKDHRPVMSSAGAAECTLESSIQKFTRPLIEDLSPSRDSAAAVSISPKEVPGPPIKVGSPFRLIQDYASDDSAEDDDGLSFEDVSPVRVPPSITVCNTYLQEDEEAKLDIDVHSKNVSATEKGLLSLTESGLVHPTSVPYRMSDISPESRKVGEATGVISGPLDAIAKTDELHNKSYGDQRSNNQEHKGTLVANVVDIDPQSSKFQKDDAQQASTAMKVDEFGRLVKEGASDSDSDGARYTRGPSRRGKSWSRSRSRSRSPQDRWRRRSRSPWRRKEKRSRSRSWSPKKQRNRSRSPPAFRHTGESSGEKIRRDRGQIPDCFDFLRGRCYRGASCRFLHRESASGDATRRYRSRQQRHLEVSQDLSNSVVGGDSHFAVETQEVNDVPAKMLVDEHDTFLKEEAKSQEIPCRDLSVSSTDIPKDGELDEKAVLGPVRDDVQPVISSEAGQSPVTHIDEVGQSDSQEAIVQGLETQQVQQLQEEPAVHFQENGISKQPAETVQPSLAGSFPNQPTTDAEIQHLPETPAGEPSSRQNLVIQPSQASLPIAQPSQPDGSVSLSQSLPPQTSTTLPDHLTISDSYPEKVPSALPYPIPTSMSQPGLNQVASNHPFPPEIFAPQSLSPKEFRPPNFSAGDFRYQLSQLPLPPPFPQDVNAPHASHPSKDYNLPPVSANVHSQSAPVERLPPYQVPLHNQHSQYPAPSKPSWTSLPPPPSYVNELTSTSVMHTPGFHPSEFQQNLMPPRNDFPQPLMRPYPHEEPTHSQAVDFHPRPFPPMEEPHRPPFHVEDFRLKPPPMDNMRGQPLGGPNFIRDKQYTRSSMPEGNQFHPGPQHDYRLHPQPQLREEHHLSLQLQDDIQNFQPLPNRRFTSQFPVQDFTASGSFGQDNMRSQPVPFQKESPAEQMQSFPDGNLLPRSFSREDFGTPSTGNLSYTQQQQSSFGSQRSMADSFPSHLGAPGKVDPSMSRYPSSFLGSNKLSHLSDAAGSKISNSTHYNPFASTFEQPPGSSKFNSSFSREIDTNYSSKYGSSFGLSDDSASGQGIGNLGSRQMVLPPDSSMSGGQILLRSGGSLLTAPSGELNDHTQPREPSVEGFPGTQPQFVRGSIAGDQYDPLFDSIEPSSNTFRKLDHVQERDPTGDIIKRSVVAQVTNDSVIMLRLGSSHRPVDAEENNMQKGGAVVAITSPENDEFGETAIDAEVGAVENGSPQPVERKDWSPSNPIDLGNTATGEIEIDQVQTTGKSKKSKDSRSMKLFKIALADFVKEVLKPSWRQGNMSKEAFKTIVKKTVDKVSGAMKNHQIPKTQAKIDQYVESSQRKLTKLVMGYVDKYVKA